MKVEELNSYWTSIYYHLHYTLYASRENYAPNHTSFAAYRQIIFGWNKRNRRLFNYFT